MSAATATTATAVDWRKRIQDWGPTYGALVALVVLLLGNALLTPNFATVANLWTILVQVSTTVLVALGMTVVIATGGIDLSVGSVMAISMVVAATSLDRGAGFAVVAALAASAVVGVVNGLLITKAQIQPFVVTLAMMIGGRGVAQVVSHEGELIPFENPAFESLGKGYIGPVPAQVAMMIVGSVIAFFVMRATTFGRYIAAVGGNERAARLAGINVDRTKLVVYATSGLLAGLAGVIETARLGTTDAANLGGGMELDAIAAVVVGGTPFSGGRSTIFGTVVGAFILAVIRTSFNMHLVPFAWSLVVKAAIIVFAVYIQRARVA